MFTRGFSSHFLFHFRKVSEKNKHPVLTQQEDTPKGILENKVVIVLAANKKVLLKLEVECGLRQKPQIYLRKTA